MLKTIAEVRLLIEDMEANYSNNLYKLQGGATVTTIKELNGATELMSKPFDFAKELESLDAECSKIAYYKGLLAKANNDTPIDDIDTIQTAIVKLQKKRKLLEKIEYILNNTRESKKRKSDGGLSTATAYYEEVTLNFDEANLAEYRDSLRTELNSLEVKIQNANNTNKITIED